MKTAKRGSLALLLKKDRFFKVVLLKILFVCFLKFKLQEALRVVNFVLFNTAKHELNGKS
jgi:hypothetical protein